MAKSSNLQAFCRVSRDNFTKIVLNEMKSRNKEWGGAAISLCMQNRWLPALTDLSTELVGAIIGIIGENLVDKASQAAVNVAFIPIPTTYVQLYAQFRLI